MRLHHLVALQFSNSHRGASNTTASADGSFVGYIVGGNSDNGATAEEVAEQDEIQIGEAPAPVPRV